MHLQMFQSKVTVFHLIPYGELFPGPELGEDIIFLRNGAQPRLIPRNYIFGDIPLHSRMIAVFEMDGPIDPHLFTVPVYLAFVCVKVYLADSQVIHAEGMEDIITSLLKLAEQVAPFDG